MAADYAPERRNRHMPLPGWRPTNIVTRRNEDRKAIVTEAREPAKQPRWTFLTAHAVVLVNIDRSPAATVRELAVAAGLTERHVARVLNDLEAEGYVRRDRPGRRGGYTIERSRALHGAGEELTVGDLLATLNGHPS